MRDPSSNCLFDLCSPRFENPFPGIVPKAQAKVGNHIGRGLSGLGRNGFLLPALFY